MNVTRQRESAGFTRLALACWTTNAIVQFMKEVHMLLRDARLQKVIIISSYHKAVKEVCTVYSIIDDDVPTMRVPCDAPSDICVPSFHHGSSGELRSQFDLLA